MGSTCSRNSDISPHQQQEEVPYDPQGFEKILLEALKEYFSNTKLVWRNKYEVCDICGTRRHPQYHIDSKDKFKDHCIFVFNNTSYPIIASCTFSPQIKQKLKSFDVSLSGSPTSGGVTFGATMEDRVLDAVTLEQMTIFPGSICVFQVGGRIQSFVSVEIVLPVDSNKKEKYVHLYTDKKMYYEQVLVINLPESVNRNVLDSLAVAEDSSSGVNHHSNDKTATGSGDTPTSSSTSTTGTGQQVININPLSK